MLWDLFNNSSTYIELPQTQNFKFKQRRRENKWCSNQKKRTPQKWDPLDIKMPLVGQRRPALPRTYSAVPSALGGLTSGFGMGPGVPPLPWSLTNKGYSCFMRVFSRALRAAQCDVKFKGFKNHASVQNILKKRRARPISNARLNALQHLHLHPINLVVYKGSYRKENSSWDGLPA